MTISSNVPHYPFHTTVLAAALLLAVPAMAGDYGYGTQPRAMSNIPSDLFVLYDADRDGKLNACEYQTLTRNISVRPAQMAAMTIPAGLYDKSVSDLKGRRIENLKGENLGRVEDLVSSNQDARIYAVVAVGGIFGIGSEKVLVPLDQVAWQENNLIAATTVSESEFKAMPQYTEASYRSLDNNLVLGQAASMERHFAASSFQDLDRNKDDAIESSEFSAFETWERDPPSSIPGTNLLDQ